MQGEHQSFDVLPRRHAIRRRFGQNARIENIVVPALGGSNLAIAFDVVDAEAVVRIHGPRYPSRAGSVRFIAYSILRAGARSAPACRRPP